MHYFNLHTHRSTNNKNITELVNQYPDEFNEAIPAYSIGIHPWHIKPEKTEENLQFIEGKLKNAGCLAIGECGLDKRIEASMGLQVPVFEKQLLMAEQYGKPVIIHCVAAFQEVAEIKKKLRISVPMIIHGFSKNAHVAESLIANGFYISFGKYLLQKPELEAVFKKVPNDKFFLETDTTDEGIKTVYNLAAKYKAINLAELQDVIQTNFNFVFHKK